MDNCFIFWLFPAQLVWVVTVMDQGGSGWENIITYGSNWSNDNLPSPDTLLTGKYSISLDFLKKKPQVRSSDLI